MLTLKVNETFKGIVVADATYSVVQGEQVVDIEDSDGIIVTVQFLPSVTSPATLQASDTLINPSLTVSSTLTNNGLLLTGHGAIIGSGSITGSGDIV